MWDSIDDPSKRREIRYGNNIYVLFRALLHCRKFYGQDSLWVAIGRGFNTSPTIVRVTAEILTEARRAQRNKPSKDTPDTARAADEWIDFLDSFDPRNRGLSDPEVYKVTDAFFKEQDKRHLNAAGVPVNSRQRPLYIFNGGRPPAGDSFDGANPPIRGSGMPLKLESPRESDRHRALPFERKRSGSPEPSSASKSRRVSYDTRRPRLESERHGALDELPNIQPTQSPPRQDQSRPAPPAQPAQATQSVAQQTTPQQKLNGSNAPGLSARAAQVAPQPTTQAQIDAAPIKMQSAQSLFSKEHDTRPPPSGPKEQAVLKTSASSNIDDASALRARIASLEKQLAEAKIKLASPASAPDTSLPNQLGEDMVALKKEMATATNAVSTIMESMHDIVDNLQAMQGEIATLSTEQRDLKTNISELTTSSNDGTKDPKFDLKFDLNTILQPLQELNSKVDSLRTEVSELKKAQPTPSTDPSSQPNGNDTKQLEALLQSQAARLDKLSQQMATLQQAQQQPSPQPPLSGQPQQQQQPQSLRQAMAAAERDIRQHLATVQTFYHRDGGTGANRAVTERTADLLATLSEAARAAQAGQVGI
ncbi:hypothetical protein C7999DRAFT_42009 [Corynascus novoguineensis]|uniref:Uncharacterized protein n=1 Tax=Corynascus novoguineensis TaxID=1126955 RepID=A0AAN7HMI0_9PEZI|nr:hypothetical protein C7999DRAFT_42009 [Corynascus novoguineensis]